MNPQARTFSRLTSVAVIAALVAVTVLMTCGVAFGAPASGSSMPGSGACAADSRGSLAAAGISAESSKITVAMSAVLPMRIHESTTQGFGSQTTAISAELPPPSDPRHGRIRV